MNRLLVFILVLLVVSPVSAQTGTDAPAVPEQVMQLGRGTAETLGWHPDGNVLAVGGSLGLWLYDDTLADLAYLPDAGEIAWLVWSPNGDQLAAVDWDEVVHVWNVTLDPYTLTLSKMWQFHDDSYGPLRFAWAPDSQRLAVLTSDGTQILNVSTGETELKIPDLISVVTWNPDGTQLAGAVDLGDETGEHIRIWNATNGATVATYIGVDPGLYWSDVQWSPDGSVLVGVTSVPAALHAWDVESGSLLNVVDVTMGEFGASFDMWWIDGGTKLVTAERSVFAPSGDDFLMVWDTTEWAPRRDYFPIGNTRQIAKKPGADEWTVVTFDGTVMSWDLEHDEPLLVRSLHSQPANVLAWSLDSAHLAVSQIDIGSEIRIWDLTTLPQPTLQVMSGVDNRLDVVALQWIDNSDQLIGLLQNFPATVVYDVIFRWNPANRDLPEQVYEFWGDWDPEYTWNNDFSRVAYTDYTGRKIVLATVSGSSRGRLSPGQELVDFDIEISIWQIAWSPDSSLIAVVGRDPQGETSAWVYDAGTGDLINRLRPSFSTVIRDISWSPDGTMVALVGSRDTARSGETENCLDVLKVDRSSEEAAHVLAILGTGTRFYHAWHPESRVIAVTTSAGVGIYSLEAMPVGVDAMPILLIPDMPVFALDWSPDGMWLAGGHKDGTVRIWDVAMFND